MSRLVAWMVLFPLIISCGAKPPETVAPGNKTPEPLPFESMEAMERFYLEDVEPLLNRLERLEVERKAAIVEEREELRKEVEIQEGRKQQLKAIQRQLNGYKNKKNLSGEQRARQIDLEKQALELEREIREMPEDLEQLLKISENELFDRIKGQLEELTRARLMVYSSRAARIVEKKFGNVGQYIAGEYKKISDNLTALQIARSAAGDFAVELMKNNVRLRGLNGVVSGLAGHLEFQENFDEKASSALSEIQRRNLESVAGVLAEIARTGVKPVVLIDGHADAATYSGGRCKSDRENLALSQRRAKAIHDFLVETLKKDSLSSEALEFHLDWYGSQNLLSDFPDKGSQNRRSEIRIFLPDPVYEESQQAHLVYRMFKSNFEYAGRKFSREAGRWVETSCLGSAIQGRRNYFDGEVKEQFWREPAGGPVRVEIELDQGKRVRVWPGSSFVGLLDRGCVEVICPEG